MRGEKVVDYDKEAKKVISEVKVETNDAKKDKSGNWISYLSLFLPAEETPNGTNLHFLLITDKKLTEDDLPLNEKYKQYSSDISVVVKEGNTCVKKQYKIKADTKEELGDKISKFSSELVAKITDIVNENKEYYKKIPQIDPTDVVIKTEGHEIKAHIDNDISFLYPASKTYYKVTFTATVEMGSQEVLKELLKELKAQYDKDLLPTKVVENVKKTEDKHYYAVFQWVDVIETKSSESIVQSLVSTHIFNFDMRVYNIVSKIERENSIGEL